MEPHVDVGRAVLGERAQGDDGDDAVRLRLVLRPPRVGLHRTGEDTVALGAFEDDGLRLVPEHAVLDGHPRMRDEVAEPVGMPGAPPADAMTSTRSPPSG